MSTVALLAALAAACSPRMPGFTGDASDGGGDAAAGDGGSCRSRADCDDRIPCTRDNCLVGGVCEHEPDNTMCVAPQVCMPGRGCAEPGSRTCRASSECDDRVPCTRDVCLVDGVCQNTPQDAMCAAGQTCDRVRGCQAMATTCRSAADCDDRVACTADTCGVDGRCVHVAQNTRCPSGRICNAMMGCVVERPCENDMQCSDGVYCNGVERCSSELACVSGTPVSCDDMNACTRDTCNEATRMCAHAMEPSCMGTMVRSGIYNVMPGPMMRCTDEFFGMEVVNFNITAFQFSVSGSGLTITGAPATMTGSAPMGSSFDASGTIAGDCNEVYRLQGMFTTATTFNATFSVTFTGSSCSLTNCRNQTWMVMGTLRP